MALVKTDRSVMQRLIATERDWSASVETDESCTGISTMRLGSTFKIAVRALRENKLRSVLTALGIIIGVGAVIAMVGIGNGAKAQVQAQIASLG